MMPMENYKGHLYLHDFARDLFIISMCCDLLEYSEYNSKPTRQSVQYKELS